MKKTTRTMSAAAMTAALAIGGVAIGGPAAMASEPSSVGMHSTTTTPQPQSALIEGPLVQGPLVDVGGILNFLQIGQFQ